MTWEDKKIILIMEEWRVGTWKIGSENENGKHKMEKPHDGEKWFA
jgi:hypothetical protein